MKEQLISFETAKLAKEKGFESSVHNCIYNKDGKLLIPIDQMDFMREQDSIQDYFELIKSYPNAPTQSLLQKWLREVHNIQMFIAPCGGSPVNYISVIPKCYSKKDSSGGLFETYEEALENALIESLKLIP